MKFKELAKKAVIPVLAGMVIFGSLAGIAIARSSTAAQNPKGEKQQVEEQSPNYKGSIFLGQEDQDEEEGKNEISEEQENAGLAAKAKITKEDAVKAAEAAYPDHTAKQAGIENENGCLVYEVEMSDQTGKALEVKVDAGNAKVLAAESDSEQDED